MRKHAMKKKICVLGLVLVVFSSVINGEALLAAESVSVRTAEETEKEKTQMKYLDLVMNLFRTHVKALELLTSKENDYSDNVVLHSMAIWETAGLVEHIYPGDNVTDNKKWPWKNKKEFEKRSKANQKAAKKLGMAALKWLRNQNRNKFIHALEKLKSTCRACHGGLRNWP
jgi:cytochrome c556